MSSLVSAVSGAAIALRSLLMAVGVGLLAGISAVVLGKKAVVIVPALAIGTIFVMVPYSALYAIVATTPINVEIAGPITVSRLVLLMGFAAIVVQVFRRQIPPPRLMIWPEGVIAMAFFGCLLLVTLAGGSGGVVSRLGPFIVYGVIFFVVLNYVDTPARVRNVFIVLAAIGFLQAALVIAEARFGFSPFGGFHAELAKNQLDGETRVTGTSSHPIILAGFFLVVIVCAVTLALTAKTAFWRLVFFLPLPVYFAGWWFTYARSSWIGMGLMLMTGMLLLSRPTRILALIGGTVLAILLVTHNFSMSAIVATMESLAAISKVSTTAGLSQGSESLQWRFENWAAAWAIFLENPFLGAGIDLSVNKAFSRLPLGAEAHEYIAPAVPHNMFLLVLAEAGIFSFLLFMLIWVSALAALWRASKVAQLRPYAIGLFTLLVGQIGTFFFNPLPREVWLSLAMCIALGRLAPGLRAGATQDSQINTNR